MKIKFNIEFFVYAAVILLSLAALFFVMRANVQFQDTKPVYQAF